LKDCGSFAPELPQEALGGAARIAERIEALAHRVDDGLDVGQRKLVGDVAAKLLTKNVLGGAGSRAWQP